MNGKYILAAGAAAFALGAFADFEINLDLSGKPVKGARTTKCGPMVGYAGCNGWGSDEFIFDEDKVQSSWAMKNAGAYFQRMWNAQDWFRKSKVAGKDGKMQSNPDVAFKFWRANGIKVLFTVEGWGWPKDRSVVEFAEWIAANKYEDCVAGFELGNETYAASIPNQKIIAGKWNEIVPILRKVAPKIELGIPIGEYFVNDPDVKQIRDRLLADKKIESKGYFDEREMNRNTAAFIMAFKPEVLKEISHNIYHCYGAETPYSCSYYGYKRYRAFEEAFPEIKGKKWWLSEIRPRSDEDNRCQRMFREALIMGHYSLMTIVQPEVDGFNHHQIFALSGGIYESNGRSWMIQWRDAGGDLPDMRAPMNRTRLDIGAMGVVYRILAEGILQHPLFFHHGTSKEMDTEDTFYTSARYTDEVYAQRRARKEGKKGMFGGKDIPAVKGEVEWLAATNPNRTELCLLMVNSKNAAETVTVTVPGMQFAAPSYRTVSCPERFLDCREIPGEAKPWKELAWEETQFGYDVVPMEKYEGMKPASDVLAVTIEPHTVQTVTVVMRGAPKKK